MQIPIPQIIRLDRAEISAVISDSSSVEIWDSFLSLQIKETIRISYTKALADFCQKDIARIVKKYAEPVGIDLSPHRVRHSAITAYLDVSEGNVRAAQSLSRHQNLSTLMIYDDNRHQLQGKATKDLGFESGNGSSTIK
jgi:site-specific recombinase XerC